MLAFANQRSTTETKSRRRWQQGQVLILYALIMTGLMGMAGLAVDLGLLVTTRRHYQKVADTCAVVAAGGMPIGATSGRGQECVRDNGVAANVTINLPPGSGRYAGNNLYVELLLDSNERTLFMQALGIATVPVSVRAVAGGYANMDFAVMGLLPPNVDSVESAGGGSSNIIGSMCSAGDFRVAGTLNVTAFAVANGDFKGEPTAAEIASGLLTQPCLDPNYPLPAPLPVPPLLSDFTSLLGPPINVRRTPPPTNCPTGGDRTFGPAKEIRINCPNPGAGGAGRILIVGPVETLDIAGPNDETVEILSGPIENINVNNGAGTGELILAPGWYNNITVAAQGPVQLKNGLYLINNQFDMAGGGRLFNTVPPPAPAPPQPPRTDGVSLIIGRQFEFSGNADINLVCCAASMPNGILIYHYGGTLTSPPFPSPGSPWIATATNEVELRGNGTNRVLNGSIYSPLVTPDPCAPCINFGGNTASTVVYGQVIASQVTMVGQGYTVDFSQGSPGVIIRPHLAE